MSDHNIILPSKPRVVSEDEHKGVYEIDGLYPGYGHTLGNSLRRIVLSSLPGAAITNIKIDGVAHEFSTMEGVKEDVVLILLALKKVRFQMTTDEPQMATISVKGVKKVTAGDIKVSGQLEVLNPELFIAEITDKNANLSIEMRVERGLGFMPREMHEKGKVEIGTIAVDAIFTPIRRVSYEVENMRVGDKTNHNRLRMLIETDGTITPRTALESSIRIMIDQLAAIIGFKEEMNSSSNTAAASSDTTDEADSDGDKDDMSEVLKTRIDTLDFSTRTLNALTDAGIRTLGGLARKKKEDLLEVEGMGEKGIQEIKRILSNYGITLK
jgi:DNA-directed RNA polymerase subunit alpha